MVQTLQTITFFDTEKLVDLYFNHRFDKKFDFWIPQAIKPLKNSVFSTFYPFYVWRLKNFDENMNFQTFYSYLHKSTTRIHMPR